ncbi:MAG: nuclear transport factor 2 family protein [Pseudomonadota bacterium]
MSESSAQINDNDHAEARAALEAVVQVYFDSMYESSADKVIEAFHPSAKITGYMNSDELGEMTREQFAKFVARQSPSPREKGEAAILEIVSLDVAGATAVARVRDAYLGMMFLDTLSFVLEGDRWQIYNKLYHVEGSA